jgi:molybdopterin molybdotransferase
MSLLPVDEAVARFLSGAEPLAGETVALGRAHGRVLAADVAARLTQPPFPASAMDGYAVRAGEAQAGARLKLVGESRAGERFLGSLGPGETVRIFTGAPVPDGADTILIQENAEREGDVIQVREPVQAGQFVRRAGLDFSAGHVLLNANSVLDARAIAIAASMGHAALPVRRKPRVAILSNGDELVPPGSTPGPDQIISSNGVGLAAFVVECGGEPFDLGIAPDRRESIGTAVERAVGADVLVVTGGASVGEHDLVQTALQEKGMALDFWKIAMRPGKPLMVGRLGAMRVLGLPGNPVSTFVCAHIFLKPLVRALLGLPVQTEIATARLAAPMKANDGRQDYVRARLSLIDGERAAIPFEVQDSSMLATFAAADALIVRPVHAPPAAAGEQVPILILQRG